MGTKLCEFKIDIDVGHGGALGRFKKYKISPLEMMLSRVYINAY